MAAEPPNGSETAGDPSEADLDLALRRVWAVSPEQGVEERQVAHYRILGELGRGGQAVVHLAEDTRLGRRVALKILTGAAAAPPQVLERFVREAKVAARLAAPGIATLLDSGFEDGVPWIAMQHVDGRTLREELRESAREGGASGLSADWRRTLELVERVARTLHLAHEAGIVHRDVKPGNIMVRPDGEPVVLDFGLALQDADDLPTLTGTGEHLGTPAYMSPEQVDGSRGRADRRTDVWSLGIVLFECLTGKRPFEAPTRDGLYRAILGDLLPNVRHLNPAIPRDLATVIEVATEKNRERRYATAGEMADDLGRVRRREPIHARPIGTAVRVRRWTERHPSLAVLAVTIAVALVVALALLARARAALQDYERLADGRRLEELVREAEEELWPAQPERVPAFDAWLRRAWRLARRQDEHAAALASLRSLGTAVALPESADDAAERSALDQEEVQYREWLSMAIPEPRTEAWDLWESRVRTRLERIAARKEEISREERREWRFEDDGDRWRHDQEARFLAQLKAFLAPGRGAGTLAGVEARRAAAGDLQRRSLETAPDRWTRAAAAVASDPRFGGLRVPAMFGLVPLGPDPQTGFEEFAHLPSGDAPTRDADGGRLRMTEDSAIVLVLLPGGHFEMGAQRSDPDEPGFDRLADIHAAPVHEVTLDPFFISKFEMTQGQWLRVTGANPSRHSELYVAKGSAPHSLLHPVEQVTWLEADRTLRRNGLLLPTEAQWEYACRGGTVTPWSTGENRESLRGAANLADQAAARWGSNWDALRDWPDLDDGFGPHAPVGSFRANPFGLHDVHGNLWEWCADPSVSYASAAPRPGDGYRSGTSSGGLKVNRGGAFYEPARYLRSSHRGKLAPDVRSTGLGLRPARPFSARG